MRITGSQASPLIFYVFHLNHYVTNWSLSVMFYFCVGLLGFLLPSLAYCLGGGFLKVWKCVWFEKFSFSEILHKMLSVLWIPRVKGSMKNIYVAYSEGKEVFKSFIVKKKKELKAWDLFIKIRVFSESEQFKVHFFLSNGLWT